MRLVGPGPLARRFRGLPAVELRGDRVRVAATRKARLLGLSLLDRDAAGTGLLIPRCRSVHTFGMRFRLDLVFLDAAMEPVSIRRAVPLGASRPSAAPGRSWSCPPAGRER